MCWARLEFIWLGLSAVPVLDLHLQLLNLFGGSLVFVCVGLGWKLGGCLCVLGQVGSYVALISAVPVLDLHLQLLNLCCGSVMKFECGSLWWFSGVCVCWARLEVRWLFVCVGPGWNLCGFD